MTNKITSVKAFNGTDSFETSVRAVELANELGIKIKTGEFGTHWAHIVIDENATEALAFYQPSHAYAYLVGIRDGLKIKRG